ncbi:MAG: cbb3-type cytochrome c oxidase subunit I [Bacteroidia bacterium]
MKREISLLFVFCALLALLGGLLMGCFAAFNFIYPDLFRALPFLKSRPLHVSLVVSWIFLSAVGGIYYYLPNYCGINLYSKRLPKIHFWLFILTGIAVLLCYLSGKFGGREYWEYPPVLAIPIIISWIIFGFNYFKSIAKKAGQFPVYIWMWGTGIFFFLFTFLESYLWIFPYFRDNIVRDITVQWKAYGALFGSWNMLVYGTAIFIMERISKDETVAKSKLAFLMYIVGLANLMFGWAHHIYIVPNSPWIRYTSYIISMTELLILARIIWNWKESIKNIRQYSDIPVFKFIMASDYWIFINLILAISMSIPAVNIFTHGTHITVAHAMGTTIGINTMILLASVFFIITDITKCEIKGGEMKRIVFGFYLANISLFLFFICLITAGIEKGRLTIYTNLIFQQIMYRITPYLLGFAITGIGILIGLIFVISPLLKYCIIYFRNKN